MINIKSFFIYFLFFFTISHNSYAINIATINIDYILNNNSNFNNLIDELNTFKLKFTNSIKIDENKLVDSQNEINELSLVLNENELSLKYEIHNNNLSKLKKKINTFNMFINSNIEENKSLIIKQIYEIVKNIAITYEYDIILNENNYFLVSEQIDISNIVIKQLNNIDLELLILNNNESFYK